MGAASYQNAPVRTYSRPPRPTQPGAGLLTEYVMKILRSPDEPLVTVPVVVNDNNDIPLNDHRVSKARAQKTGRVTDGTRITSAGFQEHIRKRSRGD